MSASKTNMLSSDPATGETVWEGTSSSPEQCENAIARARAAFYSWSRTSLGERIEIARHFANALREDAESLATLISRETGKLLWDTRGEVAAMIGKIEISIAAQAQRAGERTDPAPFGQAVLRHRPHGVLAVLGPYNFPGHLPNGHIVPALLAGNCVVFKPSEETPAVGERMGELWQRAGLPDGVLELVQGGRDTGAALVECDIDGLLFTGSATAGRHFRRAFADRPSVILALELGGNNPLIAWDGDPEALATQIIQSSFITTGQRCSCARRLIVPADRFGESVTDALVELTKCLPVTAWNEPVAGFMGPLVSSKSAAAAIEATKKLEARGARPLVRSLPIPGRSDAFLSAGIYDVTDADAPDEEIFAPVLQVYRVSSFDEAIKRANATSFGLSASLLSSDRALWDRFAVEAKAGVLNWNRPTTGASSAMPFGGVGESGNHRPSAAYAADYCAFPVASFEAEKLERLPIPGMLSPA